ncbi:hypothetical protein TURTL08_21460 [Turicimonas sp. TL08]
MGKAKSKSSEELTPVILGLLGPYKSTVKSITFDNGKELAKHVHIADKLEC